MYPISFIILYYDQQMHNYFTNFQNPTLFDTIKNSWNSVMYCGMLIGDLLVELKIYELEKCRTLKSTVWLCLRWTVSEYTINYSMGKTLTPVSVQEKTIQN